MPRRARAEAAGVTIEWPGKRRELPPAPVRDGDLRVVERIVPGRLEGHAHSELPRAADERDDNLLVFGDNGVAMDALAKRFAGRVDLIYIDPPFATGLAYFSQTDRQGASL